MRLLAGVLHSDEIVWNSYTWDADAHKQINTNEKSRFIYEVSDYVADKNGILPITQKNGYRAVATNSHDPLYAALIYNYGFNAIPIDYITLNRAEAGTTIRIGVLYVKIN